MPETRKKKQNKPPGKNASNEASVELKFTAEEKLEDGEKSPQQENSIHSEHGDHDNTRRESTSGSDDESRYSAEKIEESGESSSESSASESSPSFHKRDYRKSHLDQTASPTNIPTLSCGLKAEVEEETLQSPTFSPRGAIMEEQKDKGLEGKVEEERKKLHRRVSEERDPKGIFRPLAAVLVFIAIMMGMDYILEHNKETPPENVVEVFAKEFSHLPTTYPHQHEKVWRVIRTTMKRHIKDQSPKEPVVIMIVSTPEAANVRENIAKAVAEKYSIRCQRNDPVVVYGKYYERMDNARAKEEIDKKITDAFVEDSCAAIISNFHMLPPAATTVFYQFCENDNAPFKNVSIIFTLEIEHGAWDREAEYLDLREEKVPNPKTWDGITENFLYYNLENRDGSRIMKKDMISGLLSRITPSVVWVVPESEEKEL